MTSMSGSQLPPERLHVIEPPRVCSYLPDQTAALEYRGYRGLTPAELEHLLARGWRRFGVDVFRPACANCQQCVPIRVDVNAFQPSKSQRRTLRRNEHVSVTLHPASVTSEHVQLYNDWHVDMTRLRGWRPQRHSISGYAKSFLLGDFPSTHELQYRIDGKLVGVGIIDWLPHAFSSVYFFHAPDWRDQGPGTFSLLCEIATARQLGLDYVYLGYWIKACPSMAYKNHFHPHQILLSRPGDAEEPAWLKVDRETFNVPTSGTTESGRLRDSLP